MDLDPLSGIDEYYIIVPVEENVKQMPFAINVTVIISVFCVKKLIFFSLGLFERHKLLFSFQMTIKIMQADEKLNQEELDFFIKGNIALEKSSRKKPFSWLADQGWEDIMKSMTLTDAFKSLADDIERNEKIWKVVRV